MFIATFIRIIRCFIIATPLPISLMPPFFDAAAPPPLSRCDDTLFYAMRRQVDAAASHDSAADFLDYRRRRRSFHAILPPYLP
jgi:hypothetical protein